MVRQQFGEEYVIQETGFQFDTALQGDPSVTLDYQRVTPQQWTLTKEGTCQQVCNIACSLPENSQMIHCIASSVRRSSC